MWITSFDIHVLWKLLCKSPPCLSNGSVYYVPSQVELQEDVTARGRDWVFWSHLPSFFSEILFFWKLVSHGGLDFSIFVSSTIWNQCFRSKNCSTAKGRLQRSCRLWDRLSSSCCLSWLKKGWTWKAKSLLSMLGCGGNSAGTGLCPKWTRWIEQGQALLSFWGQVAAAASSNLLAGLWVCDWAMLGWVLDCSREGGGMSPGRTVSPHQRRPSAPRCPGTFSRRCRTAEVRLATCTAKVQDPRSTTGPISYTGWPISPGVQSLFLSSTIWNRLWCRGKSSSLEVSCQVWWATACGFLEDGWAERGEGITLFLWTSLAAFVIRYTQVIDHLMDFSKQITVSFLMSSVCWIVVVL